MARADIDGNRAGLRTALGLSYGFHDRVEVQATALVGGGSVGLEQAGVVYILKDRFKPLLFLGVPVLTSRNYGVAAGIHFAAGFEWDPIRQFGVFAQVGLVGFLNAPAYGRFDRVVFLPSVGILPRLFLRRDGR